jgi:hypothetical protein
VRERSLRNTRAVTTKYLPQVFRFRLRAFLEKTAPEAAQIAGSDTLSDPVASRERPGVP